MFVCFSDFLVCFSIIICDLCVCHILEIMVVSASLMECLS